MYTLPGMTKVTNEELSNNHGYHQPVTDVTRRQHERVRELTLNVAKELNAICPASRQLSCALTKLEEARMWANAAIACNEPDISVPPIDDAGNSEATEATAEAAE
jgi:hypothetical protein